MKLTKNETQQALAGTARLPAVPQDGVQQGWHWVVPKSMEDDERGKVIENLKEHDHFTSFLYNSVILCDSQYVYYIYIYIFMCVFIH